MAEIHYSELVKKGDTPGWAAEDSEMGEDRYLVYLPRSLNYLWEELKRKGVKARVYIELPQDDEYNSIK